MISLKYHCFSPVVHKLVPKMFPNMNYHLVLTESEVEKKDQKEQKEQKEEKEETEGLLA